MSKKTLTIIVTSILLLFALAVGAYYFLINRGQGGDTGDSGFQSFSPFGGDNFSNQNNSSTTSDTQNQTSTDQPSLDFMKKLREVSKEPVSGYGTQTIKAGSILRYVEKATGHVYEVEMFSPRKERISNTTIPLAYDALWGNNNNSILARYLEGDNDTVNTYLLNISTSNSTSTEKTISSIQLPSNITDASTFGNRAFFLTKGSSGSSGYVVSFDNKINTKVWVSDISELNSQFINPNTVALNTRPDPKVPGFLYFVNTGNGSSRRVMGGNNGLSTLSNPQGTAVMYLDQGNNLEMGLYTIKDGSKTVLFPTTFPEKCVWGKSNSKIVYCAVPKEGVAQNSLIDWYKGKVQFSDSIWLYNTTDNTSTNIEDLETDSGQRIDVTKLSISEDDRYIFFVNKINNSLWSLDLGTISTTTPSI